MMMMRKETNSGRTSFVPSERFRDGWTTAETTPTGITFQPRGLCSSRDHEAWIYGRGVREDLLAFSQ